MDRFDDDILFAELRALRPAPRPEFTAELDERAAAGFPRGASSSAAAGPPARLAAWWRSLRPSNRLVPVLAPALVVLVVATVVVAITQSDGGSTGSIAGTMNGVFRGVDRAPEGNGGAEAGESGRGTEAETSAGAAPNAALAAPPAAATESGPAVEGEARAKGYESSIENSVNQPAIQSKSALGDQRDIERSAYVVLGTKPGEVSAAAAKVYEAVHAADGIVLHSSVQSGKAGATGASFDLLVPSRKLDDTLAAFSQIAEVRERHDATNDITAPTVGAAEELADANASIESLLKQLGDAETESERESLEARLREERGRHATIRSSLDRLHERASMSEVSVRIVTGNGAGTVPPGKGSGDDGWGVGDALGDAGDILTIAAGVALIGLAVLGPIALIALLLWGGNRLRVRRLRERTLG